MKLFIYTRSFVIPLALMLIINFLYPLQTKAAITDGLSITVNREAVTASALEGAIVKIKCNAGTYTDIGVVTNASGVASITDPVALASLLLSAGSCIVGSALDIQISKDGYVTTEKLGAIASLLGVANSFTFTGSDSVKFAHKATITQEGNGAVLSGATVGVGATLCIESGTLGIYYCPVPIASDGAALSIAKAGYVTNISSSVGNRTALTDVQGTISPSNILFQVKISVADELGNSITPTTITFDGLVPVASSSNVYYFAPTLGLNKVVVITSPGFISSGLTNSSLANVSASTTGQTTLTLGANATSSLPVTIGQTVTLKGLEYALKSVALKSELGGTITGIANGTPSVVSVDIALSSAGGASVIASAVANDTLYIAATGDGSGNDSIGIKLSNVTVDGGSANSSSLVIATTTDVSNLLTAATSQTTFGIGQALGNIQTATGFGYPLKVTLNDELGNAILISSLATATLGGIAVSTSTSNTAYFATTTTAAALSFTKNGYVSSATTNTGLNTVTINQTATTSITFGNNSAMTSAVTVGNGASAQGLQFSQKITLQTEAGENLTGATVTAGSANTVCTISSNLAYCPVPASEDGIANDVHVTKTGFITSTTGDTSNRTDNNSAQSTQIVSDTQYALKVIVNDANGTAVTGATVTHGGVSAATSVSNAYYFTTTGAGVLIVSKTGYDSLNTSIDTGLANVGISSSAQTTVTLTGSTPFTGNLSSGGSSATGRGLIATVVSVVSSGGGSGSGTSSFSAGSSRGDASVPASLLTNVKTAITTQNQNVLNKSIVATKCAFGKNLSLNDTGSEVTKLQKYLESKGLLIMSKNAAWGTFGPKTKSALVKHQGKVKVPTTGYFGPMTRTASCKGV